MVTLYYTIGTGVLRAGPFLDTEERKPVQPAGTTALTFDETTNPNLAKDIHANFNFYTAPGGVLKKSGVNAIITADSPDVARSKVLKAQAAALIAKLDAGTATFDATTQKALAVLIRDLLVRKFGG